VFVGEYQHTVDDKGRIVVPSKVRDHLEDGLVVTKGQERCLFVFPMDRWRDEVDKINRLPRTNRQNRNFARSFFGGASDQQLDKQGRLQVPPALRAYAAIDKDVVILGVADRLEIWDAATWEAMSSEVDQGYADLEVALSEEGI
jgi:MraZ protein